MRMCSAPTATLVILKTSGLPMMPACSKAMFMWSMII